MRSMSMFQDVKSLIDAWPTRRALAEDIGVSPDRVHKWASSNAIPAGFHSSVIERGRLRGITVSAEIMVLLHARPISGHRITATKVNAA